MVDPDLLRDHLEALTDNTLKGYGSDLADYSVWLAGQPRTGERLVQVLSTQTGLHGVWLVV